MLDALGAQSSLATPTMLSESISDGFWMDNFFNIFQLTFMRLVTAFKCIHAHFYCFVFEPYLAVFRNYFRIYTQGLLLMVLGGLCDANEQPWASHMESLHFTH